MSWLDPVTVAAWILTYAMHSTLMLGAVWISCRMLRRRAEAWQEWLWKVALLVPILTASAQLGGNLGSFAGVVTFQSSPPPGVRTSAVIPQEPPSISLSEGTIPAVSALPSPGPLVPPGSDLVRPAGPMPDSAEVATGRSPWKRMFVIGPLLLLTAPLLRLGAGWLTLRRRLRGRRDVQSVSARRALTRIRCQAGVGAVRLTRCEQLTAPIAFGFFRPEICIPTRALRQLGCRELECILAHEIAHIRRRDPLWHTLVHVLERVFFFQPLNRVAGRRLRVLAEYRCDAWAAGITCDRHTMARCLTQVADWILAGGAVPARLPQMAGAPSFLRQRVGRLLEDQSPTDEPISRRQAGLIAFALFAVVVMMAPGARAERAVERDVRSSGTTPTASETPRNRLAEPDVHGLLVLAQEELRTLEDELQVLGSRARRLAPDATTGDLIDRVIGQVSNVNDRMERLTERARTSSTESTSSEAQ